MTTIYAEYIDRQNVKLTADRDTLYAVQEVFTYYAKDFKFMPLYKRGIWDGRISMFKVTDCILPSGGIGSLQRDAETKGWDIRIEESEFSDKIPFDSDFFLTEVATTTDLEIMEHQLGPVEEVMTHNRRLILSPTSSGKSLIQYLIARYILKKHGLRVLIIVPNTTLVAQMYDDFCDYSNDGWGPENIHKIYAGQEIWTSHDVVVSTYQTAVKLSGDFFAQFGVVMVDEAHGATSKSISHILSHANHMYFVGGFTGTLDGTYMHELEMRARFGDVTQFITTRELMDKGIVAQLKIEALTLTYGEEDSLKAGKWKYPEEVEFLVNDKRRNEFVADMAASSGDKNVMILFHQTAHGNELRELISSRLGEGRKLFYVDGTVSIGDRKPVRAYMEENNGCVLLASYGTSSVGLSIKNIHWMILAHPFKNRIRVLQTIGRGLRISPTKKSVVVTDIGDYLQGKRKNPNKTYEHFLNRLELYSQEGFDYEAITL